MPSRGPSSLLSLKVPTKKAPGKLPADETRGYRLHRRFDRIGRLVGDENMARLFGAHVMVLGQGGVGSWTAEALARSGVGKITLVDFDVVCVTNANRQVHALRGATGQPKVELMAERLRSIHPGCEVNALQTFYNFETSEEILSCGPDLLVDAIDNLSAKAHLIASSRDRKIPIVVSGGASGRMDPTQIRNADMAKVRDDPFLAATRKILRQKYKFPAPPKSWDIPTIYSLEPCALPKELSYDQGQGFRCVCPQGQDSPHSCDSRNIIYGTAGFVTGSFGFALASAAVSRLLSVPKA